MYYHSNLIRYAFQMPRRLWHRRGFSVQSPSDYELVRDVLYERLHYYAYAEQDIRTAADRQMYRIHLHFRSRLKAHIMTVGPEAETELSRAIATMHDEDAIVIEHILTANSTLWHEVARTTPHAICFDMGNRGLLLYNSKRARQYYTF